MHKFDKETLTCEFPGIFDDLLSKNLNFEIIASSTIQTLRLSYIHNIVTKSYAVIFVATELIGRGNEVTLTYRDAKKRGEKLQ